jgi:hypothetical protein
MVFLSRFFNDVQQRFGYSDILACYKPQGLRQARMWVKDAREGVRRLT